MTPLEDALADAGGVEAPRERLAQLRALLEAALRHGAAELAKPRSGYRSPVEVAIAAGEGGLLAAAPLDPALRADPGAVDERGWTVAAALVAALVEAAGLGPPAGAGDLALRAGAHDGALALGLPSAEPDAELAALAFDEQVDDLDRLRARARAVPGALLAPAAGHLRPPIGGDHPLRAAEAIARLGGRPADPASVEAFEEPLLAVLEPAAGRARPHEEADPALRAARRIVQRLAGMGKWGGYHTEFVHLGRGFAGNERALALEVGEALVRAGVLLEKPSVGQRHVFLNPKRAGDVYALIERGEAPRDLELP